MESRWWEVNFKNLGGSRHFSVPVTVDTPGKFSGYLKSHLVTNVNPQLQTVFGISFTVCRSDISISKDYI